MQNLCIVIPIYLEHLTIVDKVSLNKFVNTINKDREVYFITHNKLNTSEYDNIFSDKVKYQYEYFDDAYFKDTATYSQMLLNPDFYKRFIDKGYEYMLIYQTDCYINRDDFDMWVDKGYDYIGAPIMSNYHIWRTAPAVGNGGFSLRKLQVFYDICREDGPVLSKYKDILKPEDVTIEDLYFCETVYDIYDFNKAPLKDAAMFGIDFDCNKLMDLNKGKLPTGIHAFDKLVKYWSTIIPELNNEELLEYSKNKYDIDYFKNMKLIYK